MAIPCLWRIRSLFNTRTEQNVGEDPQLVEQTPSDDAQLLDARGLTLGPARSLSSILFLHSVLKPSDVFNLTRHGDLQQCCVGGYSASFTRCPRRSIQGLAIGDTWRWSSHFRVEHPTQEASGSLCYGRTGGRREGIFCEHPRPRQGFERVEVQQGQGAPRAAQSRRISRQCLQEGEAQHYANWQK